MTQTEKKSAPEIITAVMADVQGLAKKDKNTAQGFNFRGIDAVMNAVGPSLRKHGGFIMPSVDRVEYATAVTAKGSPVNIARVTVSYIVFGQKGSDDFIIGSVSAEAFDSGDKATAKAMSVAYRTFLLQLLCLPTDEPDPDSYSYEASHAPQTAQVDWMGALASVTTKDGARELWTRANAAGAPADVMAAITAKGEELS